MLAASASQSFSEIQFDWSRSRLPIEKREGIETVISRAAEKYAHAEYADLGVYDFARSKKVHKVRIYDNIAFGAAYEPVLRDVILAPTKPDYLFVAAFHEFGHAYDAEKRYFLFTHKIPREARATCRDYRMWREMKNEIPRVHFAELMKLEYKADYHWSYVQTKDVMLRWFEESKLIR